MALFSLRFLNFHNGRRFARQIFACGIALWIGLPCFAQTAQTAQPATAQSASKISVPVYQPKCQYPPTLEDAQYCQQLAANEIAAQAFNWARYQTCIGAIGILAVLTTLGLSIKSTYAAIASVKAANRSAKAAEESTFVERAWLVRDRHTLSNARNATVHGISGLNGHIFDIFWVNAGRTPAIHVHGFIQFKIIENNADFPSFERAHQNAISGVFLGTIGQNRDSGSLRCFISEEDWAAVKTIPKKPLFILVLNTPTYSRKTLREHLKSPVLFIRTEQEQITMANSGTSLLLVRMARKTMPHKKAPGRLPARRFFRFIGLRN